MKLPNVQPIGKKRPYSNGPICQLQSKKRHIKVSTLFSFSLSKVYLKKKHLFFEVISFIIIFSLNSTFV